MNRNLFQNIGRFSTLTAGFVLLLIFLFIQCRKDEEVVVSMGAPIVLSATNPELVLSQKDYDKNVFSLNWTRGTNHGTGSSIAYSLVIDKAGNNFANEKVFELGKGVFEKTFSAGKLNELLLGEWNIEPGKATEFEAKVKADVIKQGVEDGVSDVVSFKVTPYEPVSSVLYLVGSATPNGWDISNATELTPSTTQQGVFSYQGPLSKGSFKFAVSRDGCWCQNFYTKDSEDDSKIVFNRGGSGDDVQWQINEGGNFKMSVSLLDLSISLERLAGPIYTSLYIIGDASPSGWNIADPKAFTQSAADPFVFTYEAVLKPGDFKISTFKGNWCDGDWLNASQPDQVLTATDFIITEGCNGPDNKWKVTTETQGRYKITVNLYKNTIKIEKVMLYLIGDGGPNGWNINSPSPMTLRDGVYVFEGELGANNPTGEIKFSKYKGDWCDGDWIIAAGPDQDILNTSFKIRHGCDGDDFKWKLKDGDAGTYRITIDLEKEVISIVKK